MMSGRGISSGRSLQFDTSDSFLCCSSRIFCLFCLSAVRSSAKNADEHLDESTEHNAETTFLWLLCLRKRRHRKYRERTVWHTLTNMRSENYVEAHILKIAAYRRGFPISLLIVPHSTLVSFLVFRLGKDSLRHRQNSLSPSKSGLEKIIITHNIVNASLFFKHCWGNSRRLLKPCSVLLQMIKKHLYFGYTIKMNCCFMMVKVRLYLSILE